MIKCLTKPKPRRRYRQSKIAFSLVSSRYSGLRPSIEFPAKSYAKDDSHLNCRHAQARGWTAVHLLEPDDSEPATKASKYQIRSLTELRVLFPHFFTSSANRLPDPVEQNLARKNSIQQQAISLYTSQQSRPRQIPGRSESSAPQQAIPRNVSPQSRSKQTAAEFDNGDSSDEKSKFTLCSYSHTHLSD